MKDFLNGNSEREIARKVLIPSTSVHYMSTKYESTNGIGNIIGRGRKWKTAIHTDRVIQHKIKTNRRISSSSVKVELHNQLNIFISETTIRRRAHEVSLFGRVARKKPHINKVNREKRLEYARICREKPLGFGNHVVWSDESNFNLFDSMERLWFDEPRRKSLIHNVQFRL